MEARRVSAPVIRTVDNYQLVESLGKGSMGKVKLGVHAVTGEKVGITLSRFIYTASTYSFDFFFLLDCC